MLKRKTWTRSQKEDSELGPSRIWIVTNSSDRERSRVWQKNKTKKIDSCDEKKVLFFLSGNLKFRGNPIPKDDWISKLKRQKLSKIKSNWLKEEVGSFTLEVEWWSWQTAPYRESNRIESNHSFLMYSFSRLAIRRNTKRDNSIKLNLQEALIEREEEAFFFFFSEQQKKKL